MISKFAEKFIFRGRLIFGPDAKSLIITLLLIIVPVIIFCTNVARNLFDETSGNIAGYAILMVTVVFTIYVLLLLLLTSARDPGIVPRNLHPPTEEICYDSSASIDVGRQTPTPRLPPTKEVIVNGVPVRVKYCITCQLYRPPRCSHCSVCDNCVERFDHHCPWVGQCIGMRNYRSFFLFISSSTILCIFIFGMSALNIKFLTNDYGTVWKAIKESPLSVVLMVYCFIFLWFVGGLTCFHLYLIGTNQLKPEVQVVNYLWKNVQVRHDAKTVSTRRTDNKKTTYETFRYRGVERPQVYDRGCLNNFREVFCSKIKPSRNNFHAYVQENERGFTRGMNLEGYIGNLDGNRREKVEDDREIGGDLLKISQRREAEDA
ncbi:protein S-acyltransferase 8-like isoform X1 [Gossypium australe]|uniref:S-acyltransferase n=2 Tax=Gossypium TaxID=3633 RepID=A0A5B6VWR8_9ROSI|nr:protein S-acyltransferase 8-like isoform X1 [Gossypium australe]